VLFGNFPDFLKIIILVIYNLVNVEVRSRLRPMRTATREQRVLLHTTVYLIQ